MARRVDGYRSLSEKADAKRILARPQSDFLSGVLEVSSFLGLLGSLGLSLVSDSDGFLRARL